MYNLIERKDSPMKKRYLVAFAMMVVLFFTTAIANADGCKRGYEVVCNSDGNHVIVVSQNVSVRAKPSVRSELVTRGYANEVMEILEDLEGWYNIVTEDGTYGYVRKEYVTSNYRFIRFTESADIHVLPFDDTPTLYEPYELKGKVFLSIGEYGPCGEWLKLKCGKGIGFYRVKDDAYYYGGEDNYFIFGERSMVSYGTVYLQSDPFTTAKTDAARIGERYMETFMCIGFWDDCWIVEYGEGVAFIDQTSKIITEEDVYYYWNKQKHFTTTTACETEVKGKDGNGKFGYLQEGQTVEVLSNEYPWYVIRYNYEGIETIGWISYYDTLDAQNQEE